MVYAVNLNFSIHRIHQSAARAARRGHLRRGAAPHACAHAAHSRTPHRALRVRPHSALSATPTISGRWCLPHRVKPILAVAFLKPIRQLNLVDTLSQPRGSSRPALVAPPGLLALGEDLVLLLLLRLRAAAATARQHLRSSLCGGCSGYGGCGGCTGCEGCGGCSGVHRVQSRADACMVCHTVCARSGGLREGNHRTMHTRSEAPDRAHTE